MDNLYRENILDHYKHPRNFGPLSDAKTSFSLNNPLCGDTIKISLKFNPHKKTANSSAVEQIRFEGVGCAISIASASMLTEFVQGKSIRHVLQLDKDDVLKLLGITLTPTRLKCALLPLETIHKALHSYVVPPQRDPPPWRGGKN